MPGMDDNRLDRSAAEVDPEQWVVQHGDTLYRDALTRLRDPEEARRRIIASLRQK